MKGWERLRRTLQCAYGCTVNHGEWAYFGKYPLVLCEHHAGLLYNLHREGR